MVSIFCPPFILDLYLKYIQNACVFSKYKIHFQITNFIQDDLRTKNKMLQKKRRIVINFFKIICILNTKYFDVFYILYLNTGEMCFTEHCFGKWGGPIHYIRRLWPYLCVSQIHFAKPLTVDTGFLWPPVRSNGQAIIFCSRRTQLTVCVCVCVCTVTDFSAAEKNRSVKFCMPVGLLSGQVFSPFSELLLAGSHGGGGITSGMNGSSGSTAWEHGMGSQNCGRRRFLRPYWGICVLQAC